MSEYERKKWWFARLGVSEYERKKWLFACLQRLCTGRKWQTVRLHIGRTDAKPLYMGSKCALACACTLDAQMPNSYIWEVNVRLHIRRTDAKPLYMGSKFALAHWTQTLLLTCSHLNESLRLMGSIGADAKTFDDANSNTAGSLTPVLSPS